MSVCCENSNLSKEKFAPGTLATMCIRYQGQQTGSLGPYALRYPCTYTSDKKPDISCELKFSLAKSFLLTELSPGSWNLYSFSPLVPSSCYSCA